MKKLFFVAIVLAMAVMCATNGYAQQNLIPVTEIDFKTWSPEKHMAQFEMANYIADEWRKLGLHVKVTPVVYPNPMVSIWFKEHAFDALIGYYSGLPYRMEPDFFTNSRFNSKHMAPGDWNVGEWKNPEFDTIGEEQLGIYDPEKRKPLIYKLQEIVWEDQPESVIVYTMDNYVMNTSRFDLDDYLPSTDGLTSVWNFPRIYPKGKDRLLRVGRLTDQHSWNPLAAVEAGDFWQLRLVYDRLVQVGPDGSIRMWAAESVKPVDEKTVDVVLKKDLKFHDGVPLTGEDVKFSYDYMKKWEAPYFMKYLQPVKEVELLDKYKLRFHLQRPYAPFVMNTLGQVFIIPKHIWKDIPEKLGLEKPQEYQNIPLVGSGMFKLDYWKEGQEFLYHRNTDHFMAPEVDSLTIVFRSAEIQTNALKKGDIDLCFIKVLPSVAKELEKEKNIRVFKAQSCGYQAVTYHCGRPPFNDKSLRVALSCAIPYQRIIDEIYMGEAGRSVATIMPINAYWYNENLKLKQYDLEKAKSILKGAGYRWNEKGRLCYPAK